MKIKYYLRGLGVGIIIATIILTISNSVEVRNLEKQLEDYQSEQMTKENTALAFRTTKASSETVETTNEKTTAKQTEMQTTKVQTTAQQTKQETQATQTTKQAVTQTDATATVNTISEKVVEIPADYNTSESFAKLLKEEGFVDDDEKFNRFLIDNGYSNRLHTGHLSLPMGGDYEAIAEALCK